MPDERGIGENEMALETTIQANKELLGDRQAALLTLCRLLARQVDDGGTGVSTRLTAAYLSALKDLSRISRPAASHRTPRELTRIREARGQSYPRQTSRMDSKT